MHFRAAIRSTPRVAVVVLLLPRRRGRLRLRALGRGLRGRVGNSAAPAHGRGGDGMTARVVASTISLPAGLIANGESVIVSEATYDYDSPIDYFMPGITRFSHIYYLRPRTVDKTLCSNC